MPARLGHVLAGTAGWTDPSLVKGHQFSPRGTSSAADRLRYYASRFSLVEIDARYYALPTVENARRWVERTGPEFVFDVKAYALLTQHPTEPSRLPSDLRKALPEALLAKRQVYPRDLPEEVLSAIWERFKAGITPLQEAGKLGCVLLQFPPWFTATRANVELIERARERLLGFPVAVEFRHASFGEPGRLERIVAFLRDIGASFVVVDEPQGKLNSMPPVALVADPRLAVVRFHGHRTDTWGERASVAEKFDWLYDPAELAPWVDKVKNLAAEAQQVHLVFNNCVSNYAVLGAQGLVALLAGAKGGQAR